MIFSLVISESCFLNPFREFAKNISFNFHNSINGVISSLLSLIYNKKETKKCSKIYTENYSTPYNYGQIHKVLLK